MNFAGLALASRYAYPPNSFSLCGPEQQTNLEFYATTFLTDKGTQEILKDFATMYPYLCFIAGENHLRDEFDPKVVESYWLGNTLLKQTKSFDFLQFLTEGMGLSKKLPKKHTVKVNHKVGALRALPHHAFHVLNVYTRTGNLNLPQTLETMDACIINWGKVIKLNDQDLLIQTKPLSVLNDKLGFYNTINRKIKFQGLKDKLRDQLSPGCYVSYHWGYVCEKLTPKKLQNLQYYTNLAVALANL